MRKSKTEERQFELFIEGNEVPYWSFQDIMGRYAFAAGFVNNKVILEIGCGHGYGTNYLAERDAKLVVGADMSEAALEYCRRYSGREELQFVRLDATRLPFDDSSFDVIVSYEVIEHLRDQGIFLSEVARLLKDGGIFICSTPNREVTSPLGKPLYKFHQKEFSPHELESLAKRYFSQVSVYGQRYLGPRAKFEWRVRSLAGYVFERVLGNRQSARRLGGLFFRRDYRTVRVGKDAFDEPLDAASEVKLWTGQKKLTPGGIVIVATKGRQP
jgi:SAM-dependent methyltransferase